MFNTPCTETIAHYTRGMATMFFIMQAVLVFPSRRRDRMTYLLFVTVLYLSVCYVKDAVFLFGEFAGQEYVDDMVSIIDSTCTPFVCAYFCEATSPGFATVRRVSVLWLLFAAFIPLYAVFHAPWVVTAVFGLSLVVSLLTVVLVLVNAVRYNRCLTDNYSYTKDIDVRWIVKSTVVYFLWFFAYCFCFSPSSGFGEVAFDFFSIVFWSTLVVFSRRHRVVKEMLPHAQDIGMVVAEAALVVSADVDSMANDNPGVSVPVAGKNKKRAVASDIDRRQETKDDWFAVRLQHCMTIDKLYLNPRLSLADLAAAVATNKSYLSEYINRSGKTFYDFVNEYRVAEACLLIDDMPNAERLPMSEVAARSGFNSISTFNRYFFKIKGATPTDFLRRKTKNAG